MKTISSLALAFMLIMACEDEKKDTQNVIHDSIPINRNTTVNSDHPVPLKEVFKVHGGISQWSAMGNLCFQIQSRTGIEIHTISLPDRRVKIESTYWSIGYDGEEVWLLENKENAYKGDPGFYYNLMFYFYAMPFVLGDSGIEYKEVKATELDGMVYEGIKVAFKEGVGSSPKDEYILYFQPETYRMAWLGYTVTKGSDQKSSEWHYIKYDRWQDVNGLLVPSELVWYTAENGKPGAVRNKVNFTNVTITESILDASVFAKPAQGQLVKG